MTHPSVAELSPIKAVIGCVGLVNCNNRTEEAIGSAHDLWTAYREGAFGKHPKPFVGWMILVEDSAASRSPVRDASPHFPVFPEFQGAFYQKRYDLLCQRLVQGASSRFPSFPNSPKTVRLWPCVAN